MISSFRLMCLFAAVCCAVVRPAGASPQDALSPEETARRIDEAFRRHWASHDVQAAPPADDAEFFRRLYLDLAGRIPSASEARQFLADTDPLKREKSVEQLLDGPAYVRHMTTALRSALIPQATSQPQFRVLIPGFEAWLWQHVSEDSPWDQITREIITTPIGGQPSPDAVLSTPNSPDAFFAVRELKPENLATGTARAFLGVRLDCAQCHDHPFDKWKQQQFWNLAAFYASFQGIPDGTEGSRMVPLPLEQPRTIPTITIPGTGEAVPAVFLTGDAPTWSDDATPREVLAGWITDRNNPWFARMAANRVWAQLFGLGLVHPVDDFSESNAPTHPDVLELLSTQFAIHGYDHKFLIRTLTRTQVYQSTSRMTDASQEDPTQFARASLRGLTAEQLFDSLAEAVGYYQPYRSDNPFVVDADTPRARFLDLFRDEAESPLQKETTILQALAMMNSDFVGSATSLEDSRTLRAIAEFPLMSDNDRLDTLFLATLSRFPDEAERVEFSQYIADRGTTGSGETALADVFWALLNSSEFLLNH